MKINSNFDKMGKNYLFAEIEKRVTAYKAAHPNNKLISLGIGDVTRPLCKPVIDAGLRAVKEMGEEKTFQGYPPASGYPFLIDAVIKYYANRGVTLKPNEVFISDGSKSDCANILNLFGSDSSIVVPDPVYPVYVDTNTIAGNSVRYVNASKENGFTPMPDGKKCDVVYLCSPNNPTGSAMDYDALKAWVDYAKRVGAVIIYDSAYEAFIGGSEPHSIFEVEGAESVAIEINTLSKMAGFTGVRCGYTVIKESSPYNQLWRRRQACSFNGVSYVVQRMAESALTDGYDDCMKTVEYYKDNAKIIAGTMQELGFTYFGGANSPYIWFECGGDSWEFFDRLLSEAEVVGTPGCGFGKNGEGFFRLTAFNTPENTKEAMKRFKSLINK